ncbi:porin family protein [Hellea sp.]|nr:porin family protein [Hellea sp.]
MKFLKIAISAVAIAGFATTASAQDTGAYINAGVDAFEFDAYTLSGKLGYKFTKYFGVEGQAGFGIIDDDDTIQGIDTSVGVDSTFSGFGIARIPTGSGLNLFIRGGYHFTQLSASAGDFDVDVDVDGFALGIGSEYSWDGKNGIRLEYTYLDAGSDDDFDIDGGSNVYSLSYVRNF